MYIPRHFRVTDQTTIDEFIELNGFASRNDAETT